MIPESKKHIVKILYIDPSVDEKSSSEMLEQSTTQLDYTCVLTVVPNAFLGLECTEHTFYDLIIAKKNLQHLQAMDMMKVLEMVGARTPFVLLLDRGENIDMAEATSSNLFFNVLHKPFSTVDLCATIQSAVEETSVRFAQMNTKSSLYYNPLLRQSVVSSSSSTSLMTGHGGGHGSNGFVPSLPLGVPQPPSLQPPPPPPSLHMSGVLAAPSLSKLSTRATVVEDELMDNLTTQSSISIAANNNNHNDPLNAAADSGNAIDTVSLNQLHSMLRIYRNQVQVGNSVSASTTPRESASSGSASTSSSAPPVAGGSTADMLAYQSLLAPQQQSSQPQQSQAPSRTVQRAKSTSSSKPHPPSQLQQVLTRHGSRNTIESGCTSHDSDCSNGSNDVEQYPFLSDRTASYLNDKVHQHHHLQQPHHHPHQHPQHPPQHSTASTTTISTNQRKRSSSDI